MDFCQVCKKILSFGDFTILNIVLYKQQQQRDILPAIYLPMFNSGKSNAACLKTDSSSNGSLYFLSSNSSRIGPRRSMSYSPECGIGPCEAMTTHVPHTL